MSDKSWRFVTTSVAAIVQDASESVLHALSCLSILACIFGLEPFRVAIGNRSNRYMAHHGTHWNAILQSLPSCMVFNTQRSIYLGSSAGFFSSSLMCSQSNDCTDETCEPPAVSTKAQDLNPHRAPPWGVPSPAAWRLSGGFHAGPRWWGSPGRTA